MAVLRISDCSKAIRLLSWIGQKYANKTKNLLENATYATLHRDLQLEREISYMMKTSEIPANHNELAPDFH